MAPLRNRRQAIIDAALEILREQGLAGFSQPAVAARAKLRQSHLTYYFPTRTDLLVAVSRAAVDQQLANARTLSQRIPSIGAAPGAFAAMTSRHETTRVLVALNQAADQEPALRELFAELTKGFFASLEDLLERLGVESGEAHVDLLHALFVGFSVLDLSTARPRAKSRAANAIALAFKSLA